MTDLRSPNGGVRTGADISGDAEFVTIHTVAAHTTGDFGSVNSANRNTIRLLEMVQQKANVNYVHVSSAVVDLSDPTTAAFYGLGSNFDQALTTVHSIKFMVEQSGFVSTSIIEGIIAGVVLPFATAGVPIVGPAVVSITAYDVAGVDKNTNVIVSANL